MRRSKAPSLLTKTPATKTATQSEIKPAISKTAENAEKKEKKEEKKATSTFKTIGGSKSVSLSNTKKRKQLLNIKYSDKKAKMQKSEPKKEGEKEEVKPEDEERYFAVMWCKKSNKKHKTYSDGILMVRNNVCQLFDMEAKTLGKTSSYTAKTLSDLHSGNTLLIGGKELEVEKPISAEDYRSGRIFKDQGPSVPASTTLKSSVASKKQFKKHVKEGEVETVKPIEPFYPVDREDSIVLYDTKGRQFENGKAICSVAVDPVLSVHLRPHQKEGVKFLYESVMGLKHNQDFGGHGCILADEMGLGKTLQAVTLVWTLLKTGPERKPTCKKVLIITPTSLIKNWVKEFKRWLINKVNPVAVGELPKSKVEELIKDFASSPLKTVLIISYDKFRLQKEMIISLGHKIGLVILDEAHKIKNHAAQITKAVMLIPTRRRVMLTGTPMQNDLKEFFAMVDFCNPGVLGTLTSFGNFFEKPIMASRDMNASSKQLSLGEEKFDQLAKLTQPFILRRTADILIEYLPPKTEQVIFCKPSQLQCELYDYYLHSKAVSSLLCGSKAFALDCMQALLQLCNHPHLIYDKVQDAKINEQDEEQNGFANATFPEDYDKELAMAHYSGKMQVLTELLAEMKSNTDDKIVIVSLSVKALDVFEKLCVEKNYKFLRLDGSTGSDVRQKYVDLFNAKDSKYFVFLLSSKAGGVGLNLIGANRLVLYDSDWNPATDKQAMARIWRDGQKKKVWLYRFLTTGTIEEKVFQRQLAKTGLSRSVVDSALSKVHFSKDELKDIFTLNVHTDSDTHDLIGCPCWEEDLPEEKEPLDALTKQNDISKWKHYKGFSDCTDEILKGIPSSELVSAVFEIETNPKHYEAPVEDEEQENAVDEEDEE